MTRDESGQESVDSIGNGDKLRRRNPSIRIAIRYCCSPIGLPLILKSSVRDQVGVTEDNTHLLHSIAVRLWIWITRITSKDDPQITRARCGIKTANPLRDNRWIVISLFLRSYSRPSVFKSITVTADGHLCPRAPRLGRRVERPIRG